MQRKKSPAPTARTGAAADLMAGDPNESNDDAKCGVRPPQGAGGLDPADDAGADAKKRAKRRLTRVLR
jgi:hypothetical protein